jgi:hypothetical protein
MTRSHRLQRDEDGAILLLALAFLTAVAVMVTALIGQGDGAFRATIAFRQALGTQYAADAAVQEAMTALAQPANWLSYVNVQALLTPTPCPNVSGQTTNPANLNTVRVSTFCTFVFDQYPGLQLAPRIYEINACLGVTVVPCATPLLRANVTISRLGYPVQATLTLNDWSVLYGSAT